MEGTQNGVTSSRTRDLVERLGDLPLEHVSCYLCGSDDAKVLVEDPPFRVLRCRRCGLGYTSPRIDGSRIHEIYGDAYWNSDSAKDYGYTSYEEDHRGYQRTFEKRAALVQRFLPAGRVLEVGCAAGFFLDVMQQRGYEVHGLEISADIARSARHRLGTESVHAAHLADAPFPAGRFDMVVMWDVVEHMADPVRELAHCHRLLRPDGLLVLQTQNLDSLARRALGARWHHFKQLEHIYHFNDATIRELLRRSGFGVLKTTARRAGKYVSFDFIAERSARLGRWAAVLASPLRLLGRRFLYVNPLDELIVLARRLERAGDTGGA